MVVDLPLFQQITVKSSGCGMTGKGLENNTLLHKEVNVSLSVIRWGDGCTDTNRNCRYSDVTRL